ncbi:glycolate oxidase subunit GlcE [Phenylobacterium sp.]|uniref:glycolate oxidase subunit GlcE n=1 Tax=Phenylobacterium sp. TaxID=1871053 RepID=UPI0030F3DCBE
MRTSPGSDLTQALAERVRAGSPLRLEGGGTRAFYGRRVEGETLSLAGHRGVVDYDPSELVITARAGTPVAEIEALLAGESQMLAFEPPVFGQASTLGGAVASGMSGPRRPFVGPLRDYVLGARLMTPRGEVLRFGGTVFKNVAGFDAFRLMAGSLGCFGPILEVSLRVTPRPRVELALVFEMESDAAQTWMSGLMGRPLPLSGAFHDGSRLHLRLSGGEAGVAATKAELGGEDEPLATWDAIRHMTHPVFEAPVLWRVSLPPTGPADSFEATPWDWAGGQRWLAADTVELDVWERAARLGGHATLFKGEAPNGEVFQPLASAVFNLHRRVKAALDPAGIFNPGRMHEGL